MAAGYRHLLGWGIYVIVYFCSFLFSLWVLRKKVDIKIGTLFGIGLTSVLGPLGSVIIILIIFFDNDITWEVVMKKYKTTINKDEKDGG